MFVYRPPKDMCWGHAVKPKDPLKARQKVDAFVEAFFERVEQRNAGSLILRWESSILPNITWPEEYLKPVHQTRQEILFIFTGDRVSFPLGLLIPISPHALSSYAFIGHLSQAAPFRMSPKHFNVVVRIGKQGTLADRKPDLQIAKLLTDALMNPVGAA
jgi:hypothetical protein